MLPGAWTVIVTFFLTCPVYLFAQSTVQTIRGVVIDQHSEVPLPGATIIISSPSFSRGIISDKLGAFRADGIPVGRYNIETRYVGYEPVLIPEVIVTSSRPVILEIRLQETTSEIQSVEVKAQVRKDIPINRMAVLSARTFTVEETRRFAGGFDDPGRMAASFAGVAGGSPNDNALSIRGNAPKGLSWRVEGVAVPNPNHFAGMLVEGGGIVSLISGQLLNNSDFFTGAFPVEYGNALSGVFDMNLRAGNNEKRGWGLQAGTLGVEGFGEGPFIKGKNASYLFNYRYSTTLLLKRVIPDGQLPKYQDLSFKLNFPTAKAGIFSVWGIGGLDLNGSDPVTDSTKWNSYWDRIRYVWEGRTGILGVKHRYIFAGNTAIHTSITASSSQFSDSNDLYQPDGSYIAYEYIKNKTSLLSFSSVITRKFSKKLSNRTGFVFSRIAYDIAIRAADNPGEPVIEYGSENGKTGYMQGFSQLKWMVNPSLSLSGGVHSMWYFLNNTWTLEPRLGIAYKFLTGNSVSIAYGNHSQIEPLPVYFYQYETASGETKTPNQRLSPSRSHHFVVAYNRLLAENLRLTAEVYYQHLYNIPVKPGDYYSLVNFKKEYVIHDSLSNDGVGTNKGIDLTVEKFLSRNYYFLIAGSLIDSKYRTDDHRTYNTRWDYGYVLNLLGGCEFFMGRNRDRILGINARLVFQGGERTHPVDQEKSRQVQGVVYDYSRAWEDRFPSVYYIDFTATLRVNRPKYSSIWGVQIKNLLFEDSVFYHEFNSGSQTVVVSGEGFIFPNISYKIEF
jgi:hypothetical protein